MAYNNKEDQLKNQRKKYRERKLFVLDYKFNSNGCEECGWKEHKEILQFHHKNREDKLFEISSSRLTNMSLNKIIIEIRKCSLRCPNCHTWKHFLDGNPHGNKNIS